MPFPNPIDLLVLDESDVICNESKLKENFHQISTDNLNSSFFHPSLSWSSSSCSSSSPSSSSYSSTSTMNLFADSGVKLMEIDDQQLSCSSIYQNHYLHHHNHQTSPNLNQLLSNQSSMEFPFPSPPQSWSSSLSSPCIENSSSPVIVANNAATVITTTTTNTASTTSTTTSTIQSLASATSPTAMSQYQSFRQRHPQQQQQQQQFLSTSTSVSTSTSSSSFSISIHPVHHSSTTSTTTPTTTIQSNSINRNGEILENMSPFDLSRQSRNSSITSSTVASFVNAVANMSQNTPNNHRNRNQLTITGGTRQTDPIQIPLLKHEQQPDLSNLSQSNSPINSLVTNGRAYENSSPTSSHNNPLGQACMVCGDVAIGKNFGVLTCGSCKIFFRRNIAKTKIRCRNKNGCQINKSNRRNCASCRLRKCLELGMKVKQSKSSSKLSSSISGIVSSSARLSIDETNSNGKRTKTSSSSSSERCLQSKMSHTPTTNRSRNNSIVIIDDDDEYYDDDQEDDDDEDEDDDEDDGEIDVENDIDVDDDIVDEVQEIDNVDNVKVDEKVDEFNDLPSLISEEEAQSRLLLRTRRNHEENQLINETIGLNLNSNNGLSSSLSSKLPYQLLMFEKTEPHLHDNCSDLNRYVQNLPPPSTSTLHSSCGDDDCSIIDISSPTNKEEEEEEEETDIIVDEQQQQQTPHKRRNTFSNTVSGQNILSTTTTMVIRMDKVDDNDNEKNAKHADNCDIVECGDQSNLITDHSLCRRRHSSSYQRQQPSTSAPNNNTSVEHVEVLQKLHFYHQYHNHLFVEEENDQSSEGPYEDDGTERNRLALIERFRQQCINNQGIKEAKHFNDKSQARVNELISKYASIQIRMGVEYQNCRYVYTGDSNAGIILRMAFKEREFIEKINRDCKPISRKPLIKNPKNCTVSDSLERGIFHANRTFKTFEDFWNNNYELSATIREDPTKFKKKKNVLLHMMYHLRGVQNFDDNENAWAIMNEINDDINYTLIKVDMFQQSIKKEMSNFHLQFINSFPKEWRLENDGTIFNLMTYLLIFGAFSELHPNCRQINNRYMDHLFLTSRYFDCMYQEENKSFQMLYRMLQLLHELLPPLSSDCLTACTHSVNPTLLEKIGPSYAACLMLEQKQRLKHQNKNPNPTINQIDDSPIIVSKQPELIEILEPGQTVKKSRLE